MDNLTNKRFGRLIVLHKDENRKGNYWICKCDCGNIKSICAKHLKSGDTQSCGCLQKERTKLPKNHTLNLAGKHYGKLTVLSFDHCEKQQVYWLCQCTCGNTRIVSSTDLQQRRVTSCGCEEKINRDSINAKLQPFLQGGTNVSVIRSNKIKSTNTSGVRGVYWSKRDGKWIAKITIAGKSKMKYFKKQDFKLAVKWRKQQEEEIFKPIIEAFDENKK